MDSGVAPPAAGKFFGAGTNFEETFRRRKAYKTISRSGAEPCVGAGCPVRSYMPWTLSPGKAETGQTQVEASMSSTLTRVLLAVGLLGLVAIPFLAQPPGMAESRSFTGLHG